MLTASLYHRVVLSDSRPMIVASSQLMTWFSVLTWSVITDLFCSDCHCLGTFGIFVSEKIVWAITVVLVMRFVERNISFNRWVYWRMSLHCDVGDQCTLTCVQVFRVQMCKWQLDIHNLNQFIAELKRTSPAAAVSSVIDSATELNSRWNKLTLDANEREVSGQWSVVSVSVCVFISAMFASAMVTCKNKIKLFQFLLTFVWNSFAWSYFKIILEAYCSSWTFSNMFTVAQIILK